MGSTSIVKKFEVASEAKAAQAVFISAREQKRVPAILESLKGSNALTVGESEEFTDLGGMIGFKMENDKVRFEINMDAAEASGLKISAQVQKLAVAVRRKR